MSPPLDGIRVLDLSRLLPGGFCSLLLADYGADVLKVEDTGAGDYIRWAPPAYDGVEPSASSALFLALNRGSKVRIRVPHREGGELRTSLVEFDHSAGEAPYEDYRVQHPELFRSFPDRVRQVLAGSVADPVALR